MMSSTKNHTVRYLLGALLILGALTIFGLQIMLKIDFSRNVKDYLKLAADANTIELAEAQLGTALDNIESRGWTGGYTSALYESPLENVGFWYDNLKASKEELTNIRGGTSLEKTNTLIKLRETLLDGGNEGKTRVTYPKGIQRFPHNLLYGCLSWAALFGICLGGYLVISPETWQEWNTAAEAAQQEPQ